MTILTLFFRTILAYVFVLLSLRIMGKREIGKLSVFDLVVSIMIAEISAVSLQDLRIPIWHGALVIALLVLLQVGVSVVSLHSKRMHDLVEGKPTVLIANGEIRDREMKRTRYNMSDLLLQLREKNITSVADVEFAILETSGKLSVFPVSSKSPITPSDLSMSTPPTQVATSLIVDGTINYDKLAAIGQTPAWLRQQYLAQGYQSEREIFYASWDGQTFKIDRVDAEDQPPKETPTL